MDMTEAERETARIKENARQKAWRDSLSPGRRALRRKRERERVRAYRKAKKEAR